MTPPVPLLCNGRPSPPLLCKGRPSPPLLCKEGCGEVESRLLYPTQPPLTKGRREPLSPCIGRRERLSPDKGRRKLRMRASRPFVNNPG